MNKTVEDKNKNPQPDIMQRVRDLGTLSLKGVSPSFPFPQGSGNPEEGESERVGEPQGMADTKNTRSCQSLEQKSYELRD